MPTNRNASQRRYPPELRERAVRMVAETVAAQGGERHGVVTRVAHQLGIGVESLPYWVKQAEIDAGKRPGTTTEERRRIAELEKENRELRRSNEILKAAARTQLAIEHARLANRITWDVKEMPLRQARRLGPPSGHYILNVAIEEVVDCTYMLHGQFVPNKKWKLAHLVKCSVISLAQATLLNDALRCDPTSMADLVRRIDALEKFCHGVEGLLDGGSLALESRRRFQSRIQFLDQTFADSVSKNVNGSVADTVRDIANYSLCESSVDLANTLANYSSLGPWKTLMPEVRAQLKPEVDGGHPDASSHIQHAHTA